MDFTDVGFDIDIYGTHIGLNDNIPKIGIQKKLIGISRRIP